MKHVKSKSNPFPINLQLFADGDEGGNTSQNNSAGAQGGGTVQRQQQQQQQAPQGRLYTEDELKGVRSEASRNAQRDVLKRLGITDKSNADALFKEIQAFVASRKTPEQEANEKVTAAEERAIRAEAKVEALIAGVKPACLDDFITIAAARAKDGKALKDVFAELKKAYPEQFVGDDNKPEDSEDDKDDDDQKGTGSPIGNSGKEGATGKGKGKEKENLGALLAAEHNKKLKKKSFFA